MQCECRQKRIHRLCCFQLDAISFLASKLVNAHGKIMLLSATVFRWLSGRVNSATEKISQHFFFLVIVNRKKGIQKKHCHFCKIELTNDDPCSFSPSFYLTKRSSLSKRSRHVCINVRANAQILSLRSKRAVPTTIKQHELVTLRWSCENVFS